LDCELLERHIGAARKFLAAYQRGSNPSILDRKTRASVMRLTAVLNNLPSEDQSILGQEIQK